MNPEWSLTREAFDKLLGWLSPDREEAGRKYEDIRRRLIRLFNCRGCDAPEELTDKTINRVIRIIEPKEKEDYSGDPILLFFGVARNVYREWRRRKKLNPPDFPVPQPNTREQELDCLEGCVEQLPQRERSIITRYYLQERGEKIRERQMIAAELGLQINALRIQTCRIRKVLRNCISTCMELRAA